jgi:hypothetical protein
MTTVRVRLRNDLDKNYNTQIELVQLSEVSRLLNGFAALGMFWLGAVVCILIPVLHFVLVPGGILAGIFMFVYKYAQKEMLVSGEIRCLHCNHEIKLKPAPFNWPKKELCPQCGTELVIELPD